MGETISIVIDYTTTSTNYVERMIHRQETLIKATTSTPGPNHSAHPHLDASASSIRKLTLLQKKELTSTKLAVNLWPTPCLDIEKMSVNSIDNRAKKCNWTESIMWKSKFL
jgi:hypothetical protein